MSVTKTELIDLVSAGPCGRGERSASPGRALRKLLDADDLDNFRTRLSIQLTEIGGPRRRMGGAVP